MTEIKLIIVEDAESDLEAFRTSVDTYQAQKKDAEIDLTINLTECKTVDDALQKIDNSFDGAIIDLKFPSGDDKGKEVWETIRDSFFRIPVIILTGTPDSVDAGDRPYLISVLKKGEADYRTDILDTFLDIYNTGLTRIIGGRGRIEQTLNEVFLNNLLPQLETWKGYGKSDTQRTEKALLRFTLNHLVQVLDDDEDRCFPEEVYLTPPLTKSIQTGSIIKDNNSDQNFVVMNPACDLVIRDNGKSNTDRILIVEIDPQISLFPGYPATDLTKSQKKNMEKAFKNNKAAYYHWLPKTDFFDGGFLNFRKLSTLSIDEFNNSFKTPEIQISPSFVKDMVARFSAYYARQGQPDIEFEQFINPPSVQTGKFP